MPAPTAQFLQAGCHSCRPTNSVKALKEQAHSSKPVCWDRETDGQTDNFQNHVPYATVGSASNRSVEVKLQNISAQ